MLVYTLKKWIWLDGDIGRRSQVKLGDIYCIAEMSPQYLGRGNYTDNWFLELWPMDYINPNSDFDFDMLLTQPIEIPTRYRKNANGDNVPFARELDTYANAFIAQLRKCATCDLYFLPDYNESWQTPDAIAFCSRNHHDMWEAGHDS